MKQFVVLSLVALLAACAPQVRTVDQGTADAVTNNLTYVRDERANQCFAIVASRRITTVNDSNLTLTWVPCDPEVLALIRQ
jgi:hypothetical protein